MNDFANLAQFARDIITTGSWPMMALIYGGALVIGIVGAKVAFAFSWWAGVAVTVGALVYLCYWAVLSGGIVVPVVLPQAWVAWGIVYIAGRRLVDVS